MDNSLFLIICQYSSSFSSTQSPLRLTPILSPVAFSDYRETVSPCHPAQIKGAKGGKLESDIINFKTTPAKSKFCRISDIAIVGDFLLLCSITPGSQGWQNSPLTFSKHDYTSHNFPARFLHRANRDTQIFLLHL